MRTDPRPSRESIIYYYPEDYGPYAGTRIESRDGPTWPLSAWKLKVNDMFSKLGRWNLIPPLPPGRMLEIGSASGSFLNNMARRGWQVEGIELSKSAAAAARAYGYRVQTGRVEEISFAESTSFDLIVGWMVLEHLHEPVAALRKLSEWATPRSILAISTPNIDAYERRLFRDAWFAWQLPTHLYHFNPRTLEKIMDKGGWSIERIFHQRQINNLIASTGYFLRDKNKLPAVAEYLIQFPNHAKKANYAIFPLAYLLGMIGQTGRMTVWARRKDD
jgi:2-polyprenyl-3-methyl-5-hydroxy-6-metoxy-1,4-benzoquinol methylase